MHGTSFRISTGIALNNDKRQPGTTSATSFIVDFIPRAYPTPQLCILSRPCYEIRTGNKFLAMSTALGVLSAAINGWVSRYV